MCARPAKPEPAEGTLTDLPVALIAGMGSMLKDINLYHDCVLIDSEQLFVLSQKVQQACLNGDWSNAARLLHAISVMARNASENLRVASTLDCAARSMMVRVNEATPSTPVLSRARRRRRKG